MTQSLLLTDREAAALLGISRATLWRRTGDALLPKPLRLHGVTRWRRDELLAAVEALSADRDEEAA